jgi:nucleotide-binding universal stress UspA family protein
MGRIVVGVDDSAEATAALRWALAEARLRDDTLELVHTWEFPAIGEVPGGSVDILVHDLEKGAADLLDRVAAAIVGTDPGVKIERRILEGPAAGVLVDAAAEADLLVVGSRGRGGFAGLLLGSVAQRCVHQAKCPVVVVRHAEGW